MYNRLHTISACDGQTDGRTDTLPWHSPRYAYASRGKNHSFINFKRALHNKRYAIEIAFRSVSLSVCNAPLKCAKTEDFLYSSLFTIIHGRICLHHKRLRTYAHPLSPGSYYVKGGMTKSRFSLISKTI